jgi:hypothetical protein
MIMNYFECRFFYDSSSPSHVIVSWPLATALQAKGHKITMISVTHPPDAHPNITYIVPQHCKKEFEALLDSDFGLNNRLSGLSIPLFLMGPYIKVIMLNALYDSPDFMEWLESTEKVDLIFADTMPDIASGVAYKLKAKSILLDLFPIALEYLEAFGGPTEMVSTFEFAYETPQLTFGQRVMTTVVSGIIRICQRLGWILIDHINRKQFKTEEFPSLQDLSSNYSLVLYNGHFLEEHKRSLPPNYVSVSGLHVKDAHSPLSQVTFIYAKQTL